MPIIRRTQVDTDDQPDETQTFAPGKDPRDTPVADMLHNLQDRPVYEDRAISKYHAKIRSPLTAIRARCVACAGSTAHVRRCGIVTCSLWPFRMGKNPFFGRMKEDTSGDDLRPD